MIVNDRIDSLIKHFGLNKSSFSKRIGLDNNVTIGNIVAGRRTKPSYDIIAKILEAFPEVNSGWLITGQGEMLRDSDNQNGHEARQIDQNNLRVPVISTKAQAGLLSGFSDDAYWDGLPTEIWEVDKEYKGNYVVFEVQGDSMDDNSVSSILHGDKLLCREVGRVHWMNRLHINKWNFVIVHKEEGIIVKRITQHNPETGEITCHSLNPIYSDRNLNLKDVVALYNVVDLKRKPII